ncbi:MAG TPA: IS30 family transposase, partial [Acidimicrobiales bacterium]|nr:IS30 family transposase [Acidimicrobiales bacterium]
PKSTDLSVYSSVELQVIADEINNRPRRCLGWKTPFEVLVAQGAMIA